MSNEQKKFLKSIKRRKLIVVMSQILIVVAFFGIWEYLANKNIINSFVFSKPSKIINTIIRSKWVKSYKTSINYIWQQAEIV